MVPWESARISLFAHAIQRGAGVFDVGVLRPQPGGSCALFRPQEHIARFLRSTVLVGLFQPFDAARLLEATIETARASATTAGLVRWIAYIPTLEPDVVPGPDSRASVAIGILPPDPAAPPRPATLKVTIPRDLRKAGPEVFPPQAKVGASYLGPMLAKRRAQEQGYDEVVLLDGEGHVAEAPTANVFAVRDGVLWTPPAERVLAGITRDTVLAVARADGIPTREAHLVPGDLAGADEVFLTASSFPVQGVASIDGRRLSRDAPGPVTARIAAAVSACERGGDPRFASWLVAV
jgi:branched-chain amino acid aminotransferase